MNYDYAVFIGRFAPFHEGHLKVVLGALDKSDYVVMVVGSANRARNTRNPFTWYERQQIIRASLPSIANDRVIITYAEDYLYDGDVKWTAGIQRAVKESIAVHLFSDPVFTNKTWHDYPQNIALAGMLKDASSYYINSFPQWDNSIAITPQEAASEVLNATDIRKKLFNDEFGYVTSMVEGGKRTLERLIADKKEAFDQLVHDWKYEQSYEATYGKGPHVTVDNLITQAGHVLLIERGREYGKGLYALPGGFLNRREKILDGAMRELREETKIKVPEKVLRGSVTAVKVFDDPYRSNRSHIITHCHRIELHNVDEGLPKVLGSDDAMKAMWVPVSELYGMRDKMFEDHWEMIVSMGVV